MPPLISIIIPVYNRAQLVRETLDSILCQTYQNWECIVVDDGSTDTTWLTLEAYAVRDSRFRIHRRNREPKGAPTCRNLGINLSKGEYLMFMDSDDLMGEDSIRFRVENLEGNEALDALIFDTHIFIKTPGDDNRIWNILDTEEDDLIRFLRQDMPWHTSGPLWKNKDLLRFDEEALSFQDWEYHIRWVLNCDSYKKIESNDLKNSLFCRRDFEIESISSNNSHITQIKNRGQVIDKVCKLVLDSNPTELQIRGVLVLLIKNSKSLRKAGLGVLSFNSLQIIKQYKLVNNSSYVFWKLFILFYTNRFYKISEFTAYRIFNKEEFLNSKSTLLT